MDAWKSHGSRVSHDYERSHGSIYRDVQLLDAGDVRALYGSGSDPGRANHRFFRDACALSNSDPYSVLPRQNALTGYLPFASSGQELVVRPPPRPYPFQVQGTTDADGLDDSSSWALNPLQPARRVVESERLPRWRDPKPAHEAQLALLDAGAASLLCYSRDRKRHIKDECSLIARDHRKPRTGKTPDFESETARSSFLIDSEITCLLPLIPYKIKLAMLGGELGWRQCGSEALRQEMLHTMLRQRAGSEGDRIADVRKLLRDAREHAIRHLGRVTSGSRRRVFPHVQYFVIPIDRECA